MTPPPGKTEEGTTSLEVLRAESVLFERAQPGIPPVCVLAEHRPWKELSFSPLMHRHVPEATEHEPTAPGEHHRQI